MIIVSFFRILFIGIFRTLVENVLVLIWLVSLSMTSLFSERKFATGQFLSESFWNKPVRVGRLPPLFLWLDICLTTSAKLLKLQSLIRFEGQHFMGHLNRHGERRLIAHLSGRTTLVLESFSMKPWRSYALLGSANNALSFFVTCGIFWYQVNSLSLSFEALEGGACESVASSGANFVLHGVQYVECPNFTANSTSLSQL